ncbi:MAG: hypothetical protein C0410_02610 [Anaerolinea sp.]|nr:hypothetical protein [Anaerolinea sp.]
MIDLKKEKSSDKAHSLNSDVIAKDAQISSVNIWFFCLFVSALLLLICTKSSPLYPFNDWVDSNAFFTMGKGMMNGKIPYRDLFEQKGVLLFFLHGIAYLISNNTFLGVYFLEVLSFSIFLFFSFQSITIFLDRKYTLITLPIITASILNLKCFSSGDSAEEFCLPIIAIGLYFLIKYFKHIYPNPISYRWLVISGILAGCALWVKYTLLGFWIGWMGSIFFCLLLAKQYRRAIYSCLYFMFGVLVASLPWIIYFGINHSIKDWLDIYFLSNFKYYAKSNSIYSGIKHILQQIQKQSHLNPLFYGLLLIGLLMLGATKKFLTNPFHRLGILTCGLLLVISVYGGGTAFPYYFLIFSPLIVFGFVILLGLCFEEYGKIKSNKLFVTLTIISVFTTCLFSLQFNQNVYLLEKSREDLVQYKFSSIINESESPTLLNYGALDMGFYTTTGITPKMKFFYISNSGYPGQIEEQNEYIKNKGVEFIVTRLPTSDSIRRLEEIPYLYENFEQLALQEQVTGGTPFNYFLFRKK